MDKPEKPQSYPLGPVSVRREGGVHGEVIDSLLASGGIFPGRAHRFSVYRPVGDGPFPLVVFLDGMIFRWAMHAVDVLDNLIADGEIPPVAAVFVDPAVTPTGEGRQPRYDRGFEYDALSDRLAAFVTDELLPAVGELVELSDDPDDRAILGVSSSAPGALVTAWHRPDVIRRVGTFLGSFVGLRGVEPFVSLIRKGEPRPLRVWMQSASFDHVSPSQPAGSYYAGSWVRGNENVRDALMFRGYDVEFVVGHGAHDLEHAAHQLPTALTWLLSHKHPLSIRPPEAVHAEGWETRGSVWDLAEQVGDAWVGVSGGHVGQARPDLRGGLLAGAGVTAAGPGGAVFSAEGGGIVRTSAGEHELIAALAGEVTGLAWDGGSRLFAARWDDGGAAIVTVDLDQGSTASISLPIARTGGIALSGDLGQLMVCDPDSRLQWNLIVGDRDQPDAAAPYFLLEEFEQRSGARDVATDTSGRSYFATFLGIQVCEPIGRVEIVLSSPRPGWVDSLAISGNDLYAVQDGTLYRRRLTASGSSPTAPVMPPEPQL